MPPDTPTRGSAAKTHPAAGDPRRLPSGVIALGFVSLFMDLSSEMIHSLLPVFLVGTLGASAVAVGVIEGIAEATAAVMKVFSGVVSDWIRRRKPLILLGYGLAALTKPLFPIATGVGAVLTARFLDRIGKGVRGAPRDALIADITPKRLQGAAYGLRQSMDTAGAFLGPAVAIGAMAIFHDRIRQVFWIAAVPAFVAVALIALYVREPERRAVEGARRRVPLHRGDVARLGARYWWIVAFAGALTLARFSEAFLLLRAQSLGLAIGLVPLVMVVMNLVYAGTAYPVGRLSDRLGKRGLLALGIAVLIVSDLVLARAHGVAAVLAGAGLWGLHMGATQGLLAAVVAANTPDDLRGTGFGVFNLVSGGALLAASVLAGWLWTVVGPAATFLAGAGLAGLALAGLGAAGRRSAGAIARGGSA